MKFLKRGSILAASLFLLFCFSFKKLYSFVQNNISYSINFDPCLSESSKEKIKQFIKKSGKNLESLNIKSDLTSNFNFIKDVKVQKNRLGHCRIKIEVFLPKLNLNDQSFLIKNGVSVPKEVYSVGCDKKLNLSEIDDSGKKEFIGFVGLALKENLFDSFEVDWLTKNYVHLKSKENPQIKIIAKHDRLPGFGDLELIEKIGTKQEGNKKGIRADLRFAGQVIISFV